ncbi:hypothetical protein IscW_ISCW015551 [Ixodes scapularis]|uniref:Uncharacterized protein n=1 Tax=Ixodes scapularis TaxID=6945 RepID=B7P0X4_IXOSC|nr:hypothetical protein IscW_ISCW015551 [Ixodes scapularis]|eukprot:XP_002399599.1 hypothetical protein IscW_ISCW015551 [Ixodes scapularis]
MAAHGDARDEVAFVSDGEQDCPTKKGMRRRPKESLRRRPRAGPPFWARERAEPTRAARIEGSEPFPSPEWPEFPEGGRKLAAVQAAPTSGAALPVPGRRSASSRAAPENQRLCLKMASTPYAAAAPGDKDHRRRSWTQNAYS